MIIFSQEETDSIEKVLNTFKNLPSEKITQFFHEEKARAKLKNKEIISYEHAKKLICI